MHARASLSLSSLLFAASLWAGCDLGNDGTDIPGGFETSTCSIPQSQLASGGVAKDGIPALTDPTFVAPNEAGYLSDDSRVIGIILGGEPVAIPHNILWWHEIVNLNVSGDQRLAVTYCPLTGSSMAFDRAAAGGAEFGVSGLLFQNNLTMYDRNSQESLWPQMNRAAGCGTRDGTALPMVPILEATWAGWQSLYPETRVVSAETGFSRTYNDFGYPYGDYERESNRSLLFSMSIDGRRPPKERVLGIASQDGGIAFPFGELGRGEVPLRAVSVVVDGETAVVFWDAERRSAMAYRTVADGTTLLFEARGDALVDTQTGSTWRVDGQAVAGPMTGARLEPIAEAYVAFWFAWAAFEPQTRLWTLDG